MPGATLTAEIPIFYPAAGEDLFGVFTTPAGEANGMAVILMTGGGWMPAMHRNRLWVRLAQSLASRGFHVFRTEFRGIGESTGSLTVYDLRRPYPEDLEGAVRWVELQGFREIILLGTCFGSRTVLGVVERVANLRGAVLLAPPVLDGKHGLAGPGAAGSVRRARTGRGGRLRLMLARAKRVVALTRSRVRRSLAGGRAPQRAGRPGKGFIAGVRHLARRRVPTLFVFGQDDVYLEDFRSASQGELGKLISSAGDSFDVRVLPGRVNGFTTLAIQAQVVDVVEEWAESIVSRSTPIAADADRR